MLQCLLPPAGLAGTLSSCWFLGGQAVLQAGVAELVDRPDRAQNTSAAGVFENRMRRTGVRSDKASCANAREDDHDWGYTIPAASAAPSQVAMMRAAA
jgi:hypothetical protein